MAEGAERFRGLWEDEMFARQRTEPLLYNCTRTTKSLGKLRAKVKSVT